MNVFFFAETLRFFFVLFFRYFDDQLHFSSWETRKKLWNWGSSSILWVFNPLYWFWMTDKLKNGNFLYTFFLSSFSHTHVFRIHWFSPTRDSRFLSCLYISRTVFFEEIQTGVWAPLDFFSSLFSASSFLVSVSAVMGFLSGVLLFSVSPANFPFSASSNASFSSSNCSAFSEIFKGKKCHLNQEINHRGSLQK